MALKICKDCGESKPQTDYYKTGEYLHSRCKSCHNKKSIQWSKENPKAVAKIRRRAKLKSKYGISVEEYDKMFKEQDGKCYLCNNAHERRPLNVDHDHKTGEVRKLLCDKCNMALGLVDDNSELLQRMANYVSTNIIP
jgi:hypothetical protein